MGNPKTKRTLQLYCIVSDVRVDTHDTYVRLYWADFAWSSDGESSVDYTSFANAKNAAQKVKDVYPVASIQILSIHSESESKLIDI